MFDTAPRHKSSVLIIGCGIAGCTTALELARSGLEVTMVTSSAELASGNSVLAQGGIVYRGEEDSPEILKKDILTAGWNVNYRRAVQYLARHGSEAVHDLLLETLDIPFERDQGHTCKLTREGGHSLNRILYCADYTGKAIMQGLYKAIAQEKNIDVLTNRMAIDLLTTHHHSTKLEFHYQLTNQCVGAYFYNLRTGLVETVMADITVLATGGVGQIYVHTTNARSAIGSGLSMGYRSGVKTMNCEYIQFHPTALFQRGGQQFLISEAVRGEGARFIRMDGTTFMKEYDPRGDLAPRDVVTRAIVQEMLKTGDDFVYLDAANYVPGDISARFPTIYQKCLEVGVDMGKDPIPVVPAAHFFCGGILVDLDGRTTLSRLYAIGECSCTGVHGANRLASTSLLEGLLWGRNAAKSIASRVKRKNMLSQKLMHSIPDWANPGNEDNEDPALIAQDWAQIKNTMWNYVGIVRTTSRLKRANQDLQNLSLRLHEFYKNTPISKPLIELFHGCQASVVITRAA
ncbi:MAG: L-aspartate oxidase, partial [Desulfovermiculus sp.]|nr:L-aspartate oxidase [Desulfovermiculus sp.]